MKKIGIFLLLLVCIQCVNAQDNPVPKSGLGEGLNFSLSEDQYQFRIGGFLQPSIVSSQLTVDGNSTTQYFLRTKRSYLNFSGKGVKEKVSFFIQADFSSPTPLLDAWAAYHFSSSWSVSVGQRRTFTNNREMTFDEDKLQFADRGVVSTTFAGNGREFGLFVEGSVGKSILFKPQFAITSGDGPNSFGLNATDIDVGGFKYGGRLDILPLGDFDTRCAADLNHEEKLKLMFGVAASLNKGASNANGEGHADFLFYDATKKRKLPDLNKFSADILLKYKGASLLAEFVNTSASNLSGIYLDSTANVNLILKPGQISQYLNLGNAWNIQGGYVTLSGYAVDLRYEQLQPEFTDQLLSVLQETNVSTLGLSKYFNANKLKLQAAISNIKYSNGKSNVKAEVTFQVVL